MIVVLNLSDDYQSVIFCLKEVVILIVDKIVDCASIFPVLLVLSRVIKRISTVLSSLILHERLREEGFVVILDLIDKLSHFSFELEFENFFGFCHHDLLRPIILRL